MADADVDAAVQAGRLTDVAGVLDARELQVGGREGGAGGMGSSAFGGWGGGGRTAHPPPTPAPSASGDVIESDREASIDKNRHTHTPPYPPLSQSDDADPLLPPWPAAAHMLSHMLKGDL